MPRSRQQEEAHRCTDCDRRIGTNRGRCRECRAKDAPHGLCRACGEPLVVAEKVAGVCAKCLPDVLDPAPEGRCECGQPLYLGRCVRCWARKEMGVRR